jgi:UTP--glucose-1-phosphate uridylyltransferase
LVEAFSGTSVVGMQVIQEEQFSSMGVVGAEWQHISSPADEKNASHEEVPVYTVSQFAEKPTVEYAKEFLQSRDENSNSVFFGVFGQYVLNSTIFGYLEEAVRTNHREHGVFGLTSALESLRANEGFEAIRINGERFDLGNPLSYIQTVHDFPLRK